MSEKKCLDIQAIKNANDRQLVEVDLTAEWGGIVYVKPLSVRQLQWVLNNPNDAATDPVKLVIYSTCDETGNALFTDNDADWLGDKAANTFPKIMAAIRKLNAPAGVDNVETLEKN